tara:strand:+ start:1257 stop:1622 length:366 start_codon:yes stop_codon:yes gene_type:complete
MPKIGLLSLKQTLATAVCEIRFAKRRAAAFRNMLCTLDLSILNSVNGRTTLNYKPPSGPPKYVPESKNLLLVWDIFMQDWRMVSMENCDLIKTVPSDDFWEYFNNTLFGMTVEEKNQFMGK